MSERGAVCSHYFYCRACASATEEVFRGFYEWVTPVVIPASASADGETYPVIIVGKAHGLSLGDEVREFEDKVAPALADVLCHSARFAIMADDENFNLFAVVEPSVKRATRIGSRFPIGQKRLSG